MVLLVPYFVFLGPIVMGNFVIFLKSSLNFRAHELQLELNKVGFSNLVNFGFQSMSCKIEQAFEKMTKYVFCLHFVNSSFNIIFLHTFSLI